MFILDENEIRCRLKSLVKVANYSTCRGEGVTIWICCFSPQKSHNDQDDNHKDHDGHGEDDVEGEVGGRRGRVGSDRGGRVQLAVHDQLVCT